MPTNLTGQTIASTYDQLLHLDGGPEAAEKVVYSGTGVATALKVGTQSVSVDNIQLDGNTIQALTGNLTLGSNIAFGSASNARTALGLGTIATQNSNSVTITGGAISGVTFTGSFSGITSIDSATFTTSATAAGVTLTGNTLSADGTDVNIDINITPKGTGRTVATNLSTAQIVDTNGNELLKFTTTASAVNELTIANNIAANGPTISATGADSDININITPKGTGKVNMLRADIGGGSLLASTELGFAVGSGGTVTQGTSRTTGVTLNKLTGEIVLFAASISGHDADEFTLTNSTIGANDVVMVCIKSGAAAGTRKYYQTHVVEVAAGSCIISVGNIDNSSIPAAGTESPVLQFVVIKGVIT